MAKWPTVNYKGMSVHTTWHWVLNLGKCHTFWSQS